MIHLCPFLWPMMSSCPLYLVLVAYILDYCKREMNFLRYFFRFYCVELLRKKSFFTICCWFFFCCVVVVRSSGRWSNNIAMIFFLSFSIEFKYFLVGRLILPKYYYWLSVDLNWTFVSFRFELHYARRLFSLREWLDWCCWISEVNSFRRRWQQSICCVFINFKFILFELIVRLRFRCLIVVFRWWWTSFCKYKKWKKIRKHEQIGKEMGELYKNENRKLF